MSAPAARAAASTAARPAVPSLCLVALLLVIDVQVGAVDEEEVHWGRLGWGHGWYRRGWERGAKAPHSCFSPIALRIRRAQALHSW